VRNNKKTAILALMDESSRKLKSNVAADKRKDAKLFYVYRPNTGQQVKQVSRFVSFMSYIYFLDTVKFYVDK
jgi:hypothetical protein